MSGKEKDLQKKIIDYIKSIGGYVEKIHVTSYQSQGVPDIRCCFKGMFVAFELKKSQANKASELQLYKIKQIRDAGGIAEVIWSLEQAKEVLNEISRVQSDGKSIK
jgi:penicillin-binding protein-related factor A (putative recombinase)